jgi:hypothetical protein
MNLKDKIRAVKTAVVRAKPEDSLMDIVEGADGAFSGIRMLYSKKGVGAPLVDSIHLANNVCGLFSHDNVLAYSDEIMEQCLVDAAMIGYKRRVLFDTNLLSDLPKLLLGEEFNTRDKALSILKYVKSEFAGSIDFSFPLLENLREYCDRNQKFPIRKLASAYYFDEMISNASDLENHNHDFSSYEKKSVETWENYRASEDIWRLIYKRDLTYVLMLKVFHLCWSNKHQTVESILSQLVEFCLTKFDVIPLKELYFSWKVIIGISLNQFTPVFKEKPLKNPTSKSIRRIRALSWDLYLFRYCETLLSEETKNFFYVPLVTTMDEGLLATLKMCPIKAVVMLKEARYIETIFEDEDLFQITLEASMTKKHQQIIRDPDRHINKNMVSNSALLSEIDKLEKLITGLVNSR